MFVWATGSAPCATECLVHRRRGDHMLKAERRPRKAPAKPNPLLDLQISRRRALHNLNRGPQDAASEVMRLCVASLARPAPAQAAGGLMPICV